MIISIRYTKGLGNSTIYTRIRNDSGEYWNFITTTWDVVETANCRVLMTEYSDSDTRESRYTAEVFVPADGIFVAEVVDLTDNTVIGEEQVIGELGSIPAGNDSWLQKIQYIYQYLAFKREATDAVETLYKDDGTTPVGTAALSDDGSKFTKNKVV